MQRSGSEITELSLWLYPPLILSVRLAIGDLSMLGAVLKIPVKPQAVGIAWYSKENYLRLRSLFEDGDKLHPTFGEWREAALSTKKRIEQDGGVVYCVDIDPETFVAWCKAEKMGLNAEARNKYASYIAFKLASGG
jgi:hypothetical protein